jgi:energy-coupling factor transporter transmembrane protein EcfT
VLRRDRSRRTYEIALVESSPLRKADPRTKLALGMCASLAVMLPLERLAAFMVVYVLLLLWARLLPQAVRQVWRLKWVLIPLFLFDWLVIDLTLAMVVTLRIVLLAGAFTLFVGTTTPGELRLALEWLRLPYRYAFSVSLAFQSVGLLDDEWRAILEAQRARGAWSFQWTGWRGLFARVGDMVALTVPVVVLTTKRAWAMTESAYARGFDSPNRRPFRALVMNRLDWMLLTGAIVASVVLVVWK